MRCIQDMTGNVFAYPTRLCGVFINGIAGTEPATSGVVFSDGMIRPLRFSVPMGGLPATVFLSDWVSATPVQTGGVSATPIQTGGVSALTHNIYTIVLSQQKSNFPLLVLQKCLIYLPQGQLYVQPKQLYALIKRLYTQFKRSLPSYRFGSDAVQSLLNYAYCKKVRLKGSLEV